MAENKSLTKRIAERIRTRMSVGEMLDWQPPPMESLIGTDLCPVRGSGVIIGGTPKASKTILAVQMALTLASNQSFMGLPVTLQKPLKCSYLMDEMSEHGMKTRIDLQAPEFPLEMVRDNVVFHFPRGLIKVCEHMGGMHPIIGEVIEEDLPDVLFLDPFANFHNQEENSASDMKRVMETFNRVRELGISVVLVHHEGKGAGDQPTVGYRSRGSSAIPGWYDLYMSLSLKDSSNERGPRVLEFSNRNGNTPEALTLHLNQKTKLLERSVHGLDGKTAVIADLVTEHELLKRIRDNKGSGYYVKRLNKAYAKYDNYDELIAYMLRAKKIYEEDDKYYISKGVEVDV